MRSNRSALRYRADIPAAMHIGRLQKIKQVLYGELRLILGVSLKLGAAVMVLQALAWLAAGSGHVAVEVVTATASPHAATPAIPGQLAGESGATAR